MIRHQKNIVALKSVVAAILLFSYFLNVVSFESFHQAVHHHHHAELHSAEAEADACHRAIYHGETSHNCEHKSHVTKSETECDLCDVVVSRTHLVSKPIQAPTINNPHTRSSIPIANIHVQRIIKVETKRGPPTFV